ncbi:hypothetical protein DFJ73DRAFT_900673 [Zopfochytrium polystomum]|nr:hypothetical protein DFJ73DRAFT_900673 [Zopfochytrium polystomum]
MFSPNLRTSKRGDRQTKATVNRSALISASKDTLTAEDSPTVRQRISEARKSGFLDLSSLNLSILPEPVWDIDNLVAILLGGNNFPAVPANLPSSFPNLQYIDLSRNKIASIPTNLVELEDLKVLDLSGNPDLEGRELPASYGPVRHRLAVFVDDESSHSSSRDYNNNSNESEDDNGDDSGEEVDEEGKTDTDDNDEDDAASHSSLSRQRRDLMEDVALEARKFFRRLGDLEDSDDLVSTFRRMLAGRDPTFVKYLLRRYGSAGSPGSPSSPRSGSMRGQAVFVRKEKERIADEERSQSRKAKASRVGSHYEDQ